MIFLFLVQTYAFPLIAQQGRKAKTQQNSPIKIHHADRLFKDISITGDGMVLVGNVVMSHDGMRLKCDSAVFYENSNSFLAYGKIRFTQGDTLSMKGDSLYYDGTSQFAQVFNNVEMRHHKMTLYTDHLNYDRIGERGFYQTGGKIVDGGTTLTSQQGDYFTNTREANFKIDVLLVNDKKDRIRTDNLEYNTNTKWAHAIGPTNLFSGDSHIYTTDGYYNTASGKARLVGRPQLFNKGRKLTGDSILYNKETGFSEAFMNVVFTDSSDINNTNILMGAYGWYDEPKGEALATKNALAKNFSRDADTLYVHADTLRLFSYDLKTDSAYRVLHGYFHVRAYRTDVQAVCDSLVYHSKQRKLSLFRDPIAWSEDRQILGEEINVFANDSTIDSVYVERQALIVQALPDSAIYNQVAGNLMQAYFTNGDIHKAVVDGNAMLVNYPMEEDSTFLYSNYIEAAKLRVNIENRAMTRFWAAPSPKGKAYPIGLAPAEHTKLANFAWFDYIRPQGPHDLFQWRPKDSAAKLKAVPRRSAPLQTLNKLAKKGVDSVTQEAAAAEIPPANSPAEITPTPPNNDQ